MDANLAALSDDELADWHQKHVAPLLAKAHDKKRRWQVSSTTENEAAFDAAAAEFQAVHKRWLAEVERRTTR